MNMSGRIVLCITAAVSLLAVTGCKNKKQQKAFQERTTRVRVQGLEKRTFRERIPVQGTVSPSEYAVISAKIAGTLELLKVSEGNKLKKGDVLFILEAMKMENEIMAPCDGSIASVAVTKGATVESGSVLCTIA